MPTSTKAISTMTPTMTPITITGTIQGLLALPAAPTACRGDGTRRRGAARPAGPPPRVFRPTHPPLNSVQAWPHPQEAPARPALYRPPVLSWPRYGPPGDEEQAPEGARLHVARAGAGDGAGAAGAARLRSPHPLRLAPDPLLDAEGPLRGLADPEDGADRDRTTLRGGARVLLPLGGGDGGPHAGGDGAPGPAGGAGGVDGLLDAYPPDYPLRPAQRASCGRGRAPPGGGDRRPPAHRRRRARERAGAAGGAGSGQARGRRPFPPPWRRPKEIGKTN